MNFWTGVFVGLVPGLAIGAAAAFSASRAHSRLAQVLREMSTTWSAIATAQRHMARDQPREASSALYQATRVIEESRRRRHATDERDRDGDQSSERPADTPARGAGDAESHGKQR